VAIDAAAAHDGSLHLRLKLAGVAGLHLGCFLVQGIVRVRILHVPRPMVTSYAFRPESICGAEVGEQSLALLKERHPT